MDFEVGYFLLTFADDCLGIPGLPRDCLRFPTEDADLSKFLSLLRFLVSLIGLYAACEL